MKNYLQKKTNHVLIQIILQINRRYIRIYTLQESRIHPFWASSSTTEARKSDFCHKNLVFYPKEKT